MSNIFDIVTIYELHPLTLLNYYYYYYYMIYIAPISRIESEALDDEINGRRLSSGDDGCKK